jgi:hypothetical protein
MPMPNKNSTPKVYTNLLTTLKSILNESEIESIAREAGFIKRRRLLSPFHFVCCLLSAFGTTDLLWIAQFHRSYCAESKRRIGYKPFHSQLKKKEVSIFLQSVLLRFMNSFISSELSPKKSIKPLFDDILIHDGSSFAVKNKLKEKLPGRFTKTSPAAVEIHCTLSLLGKSPQHLTIAPDKEAEKHFRPAPETLTDKLILGDRGYEDRTYFRDIQLHNGWYAVRGKNSIKPMIVEARCERGRVQKRLQGKPLDLSKLTGKHYDMEVEWNLPNRKILKERLCIFYKKDHSKDKNEYTLIHTNLKRTHYRLADISNLYRYRWQVELFFKECKSYSNLHKFDTGIEEIADAMIWGALCTAVFRRAFLERVQSFMKVTLSTLKGASDGFLYLRTLIDILSDRISKTEVLSEFQTLVSEVIFIAKEDPINKPRTRTLIGLYYPWEIP